MRAILITSMLELSILVAWAGLAKAGDNKKCTIAISGDSEPAKACAKGGRPAARKVMKAMVAEGKAKGLKFKCESCHMDTDDFDLLDNAREDYKKLAAAVAKK